MFTLKKLKQTNLWGFFLKVTKIIIQPSKDANTATHIRLLYLFLDAGGDPGGGLEADLLWRSLKEAPERNARPGTVYRGITMITRHNIMK